MALPPTFIISPLTLALPCALWFAAPPTAPAPKPAPASTSPTSPAVPPSPAPANSPTPKPSAVQLAITLDTREAPQLEAWAEKAKTLCQEWYPKLIDALPSDGFTPRESIKIVFRKKMTVPAAAGGDTISVSAPYVDGHTGDFGMMVHELTHIVQAYPAQKDNLGWLTEGIADYTRFWLYEPQVRQAPIDVKRASYKDAYRTAAAFLGWLVKSKDPLIVQKLNAKLRAGNAQVTIFKDLLGKSVDELWAEFVAAGAPSSPDLPQSPTQPAPAQPTPAVTPAPATSPDPATKPK